jgi:hypothetical protein
VLIKHYAMKGYGGVDVQIHIFLTSALVGVSGQLHSRPLYPGERAPGNHWIGGWVDPRADLDYVEKRKFLTLPGLELQPLGRPANSQSLYRLCILAPWIGRVTGFSELLQIRDYK